MSKAWEREIEALGGARLAEYSGRASLPLVWIGLGLVLGALGLGLAVGGLLASRSDRSLLCLVPPGLLCLGAGAWALNEWRLKHNLRVWLYPEGFAHFHGGRVNVFRWEGITEVYQSMQHTHRMGRAVQRIYTVRSRDGKQSVLTGELGGIAALGEHIQEQVTRRMLPRSLAAYNAGETQSFKNLRLDREGLTYRGKSLPWSEVEEVRIDRGALTIRAKGRRAAWASLTASGTPNLPTLLALLDKTVRVQQGS